MIDAVNFLSKTKIDITNRGIMAEHIITLTQAILECFRSFILQEHVAKWYTCNNGIGGLIPRYCLVSEHVWGFGSLNLYRIGMGDDILRFIAVGTRVKVPKLVILKSGFLYLKNIQILKEEVWRFLMNMKEERIWSWCIRGL